MLEIFNIILIVTILVIIFFIIKNNKKKTNNNLIPLTNQQFNIENNIENFDDVNTKYINFDYNIRPIEKKFIKEQKDGAILYTWYPNTWIERIDENGKPIYNSRENFTKESTEIILDNNPISSSSYDFNKMKTENASGILKPEDSSGKTIKEIYDNSIVDYKKLGPIKNRVTDETSDIIMPGGSNLTYFTPDVWTYDNENHENGGLIYNDVYANDPMSNNTSVY